MPDRTDYQRGYEDGVMAAADACLRVQADYGQMAENLMGLGPASTEVYKAKVQAAAAGLCWSRVRALLPTPPAQEGGDDA